MTDTVFEKSHSEHVEQASSSHDGSGHVANIGTDAHGFTADAEELPKGYYYSPFFLGTTVAIGLNLMGSTGGFALVAPVLGQIAVSLDAASSVIWLSLVYTMGLAVGLTLVGRITDTFGRRWFFIGGTALGCIGAIVSSTAKSINVLIGGQVLVGLSASTGYSYAFVIGELVPVKRRFIFNAIIFIFSFPTAGFGAAISTAFILKTSAGWRWAYYLLIILNGLTAILYGVFYFPPTFHQKHGKDHVSKFLRTFDWGGLFLYTAGLVLFILGLSSGDTLYPWVDARVLAPLIIGVLCLIALFVYESYAKLSQPLIPMEFFRNRGWVASMLSLSLGASVYYSQAIVWPQMTANVYAEGRLMWGGVVSSVVGIGITLGEIIGGGFAKHLGHWKLQCLTVITLGTLFLGLAALCKPDTPGMAIAFMMLATTFVGWNEALVLPICTIVIPDQAEIGTAAGVAGSSRSAISTVASTIYSVVLATRTATELGRQVPAAVIRAGLPADSVSAYMAAIAAGAPESLLSKVQGLTPNVIAAGTEAYRYAYTDAYKTIFLVSLAFGGLAIIASFFIPDVDHLMGGKVAATLSGREKEKYTDRTA
ncbi:MFS general substrate transporter [Paraphaeosphaeria sporulosa]|uniref:MFS general substrate transporter n=1 Tax=Paraphaeosphaeria sporulosa TaxID=1460663 RepID=A0A177CUJ9_9PLEO|nr:MFS general substrate transporter [Paraphaeosphaeria sporulosa]OAG10688.1 MFS general substrate transporter [Paraphaeosphaeria sporulosa]